MNLIDRTIASMSPERALKRHVARKQLEIINSGYSNHGASRTKKSLLGWIYRGGSSKEDIEDNITILRERSRDNFMGAPLATSAIKTFRTNIVGAGLQLKSQVDYEYLEMGAEEAELLKRNIEREFSLWADSKNCDVARQNNFAELQQLALISWLLSGDCFVLLPIIPRERVTYDIRIQLIEADRVCNPDQKPKDVDIIEGIEMDKFGGVCAYWIAEQHPLSKGGGKKEWKRVEIWGEKSGRCNALQLMEAERPGQRRGVPILAPVIEELRNLSKYTDAELIAAIVSSLFTVFVTTERQGGLMDEYEIDDQVDKEDANSFELGAGSVFELAPGEKIEIANPARTNSSFDSFFTNIAGQIGAALEIPPELLMKRFTASYSASRASLLEAWKVFRMRRSWFVADFCQPIFEEWMYEAVAKGRINAPGFFDDEAVRKAYCKSEWCGPSQGQIDPLKEVKAAQERVKEGFSTREKETAELTGTDFEQNIKQRIREEQLMQLIPREGGEKNE